MTKLTDYLRCFECHISDDTQNVEMTIYLRPITDAELVQRILDVILENDDKTLTCRCSEGEVTMDVVEGILSSPRLSLELTLKRKMNPHSVFPAKTTHQLAENISYTAGKLCFELYELEFI